MTKNAVRPAPLTIRAADYVESNRARLTAYAVVGMTALLLPASSFAQTTTTAPNYGFGQAGSPQQSDYLGAAQGFNSSLSPLLTAVLPVLVVILAIWTAPKLLKKLVTMMAH